MTAVSWDDDGWDEDEPAAPATPAYRCEGPCCSTWPRRPGLLARILTALRRQT